MNPDLDNTKYTLKELFQLLDCYYEESNDGSGNYFPINFLKWLQKQEINQQKKEEVMSKREPIEDKCWRCGNVQEKSLNDLKLYGVPMSVWIDDGRIFDVILKVMNEYHQDNNQWPTQILQQVREGIEEMRPYLVRLHCGPTIQDWEDYGAILAIQARLAGILGTGKKVR